MDKWFNFKDTIDGTQFYFRLVASVIPIILTAILSNLVGDSITVMLVGGITTLFMYLSTVHKRLTALFPKEKVAAWITLILSGFLLWPLLIFGNSAVKEHNG